MNSISEKGRAVVELTRLPDYVLRRHKYGSSPEEISIVDEISRKVKMKLQLNQKEKGRLSAGKTEKKDAFTASNLMFTKKVGRARKKVKAGKLRESAAHVAEKSLETNKVHESSPSSMQQDFGSPSILKVPALKSGPNVRRRRNMIDIFKTSLEVSKKFPASEPTLQDGGSMNSFPEGKKLKPNILRTSVSQSVTQSTNTSSPDSMNKETQTTGVDEFPSAAVAAKGIGVDALDDMNLENTPEMISKEECESLGWAVKNCNIHAIVESLLSCEKLLAGFLSRVFAQSEASYTRWDDWHCEVLPDIKELPPTLAAYIHKAKQQAPYQAWDDLVKSLFKMPSFLINVCFGAMMADKSTCSSYLLKDLLLRLSLVAHLLYGGTLPADLKRTAPAETPRREDATNADDNSSDEPPEKKIKVCKIFRMGHKASCESKQGGISGSNVDVDCGNVRHIHGPERSVPGKYMFIPTNAPAGATQGQKTLSSNVTDASRLASTSKTAGATFTSEIVAQPSTLNAAVSHGNHLAEVAGKEMLKKSELSLGSTNEPQSAAEMLNAMSKSAPVIEKQSGATAGHLIDEEKHEMTVQVKSKADKEISSDMSKSATVIEKPRTQAEPISDDAKQQTTVHVKTKASENETVPKCIWTSTTRLRSLLSSKVYDATMKELAKKSAAQNHPHGPSSSEKVEGSGEPAESTKIMSTHKPHKELGIPEQFVTETKASECPNSSRSLLVSAQTPKMADVEDIQNVNLLETDDFPDLSDNDITPDIPEDSDTNKPAPVTLTEVKHQIFQHLAKQHSVKIPNTQEAQDVLIASADPFNKLTPEVDRKAYKQQQIVYQKALKKMEARNKVHDISEITPVSQKDKQTIDSPGLYGLQNSNIVFSAEPALDRLNKIKQEENMHTVKCPFCSFAVLSGNVAKLDTAFDKHIRSMHCERVTRKAYEETMLIVLAKKLWIDNPSLAELGQLFVCPFCLKVETSRACHYSHVMMHPQQEHYLTCFLCATGFPTYQELFKHYSNRHDENLDKFPMSLENKEWPKQVCTLGSCVLNREPAKAAFTDTYKRLYSIMDLKNPQVLPQLEHVQKQGNEGSTQIQSIVAAEDQLSELLNPPEEDQKLKLPATEILKMIQKIDESSMDEHETKEHSDLIARKQLRSSCEVQKIPNPKKAQTASMCEICGKVLTNPYRLKYHMCRIHGVEDATVKTLEKFPCEKCGKMMLQKHLTFHTAMVNCQNDPNFSISEENRIKYKPFRCGKCDKRYIKRIALMRHKALVNCTNDINFKPDPNPPKVPKRGTKHDPKFKSKPMQCEKCSKWISSKKNLREHNATVNCVNNPYFKPRKRKPRRKVKKVVGHKSCSMSSMPDQMEVADACKNLLPFGSKEVNEELVDEVDIPVPILDDDKKVHVVDEEKLVYTEMLHSRGRVVDAGRGLADEQEVQFGINRADHEASNQIPYARAKPDMSDTEELGVEAEKNQSDLCLDSDQHSSSVLKNMQVLDMHRSPKQETSQNSIIQENAASEKSVNAKTLTRTTHVGFSYQTEHPNIKKVLPYLQNVQISPSYQPTQQKDTSKFSESKLTLEKTKTVFPVFPLRNSPFQYITKSTPTSQTAPKIGQVSGHQVSSGTSPNAFVRSGHMSKAPGKSVIPIFPQKTIANSTPNLNIMYNAVQGSFVNTPVVQTLPQNFSIAKRSGSVIDLKQNTFGTQGISQQKTLVHPNVLANQSAPAQESCTSQQSTKLQQRITQHTGIGISSVMDQAIIVSDVNTQGIIDDQNNSQFEYVEEEVASMI